MVGRWEPWTRGSAVCAGAAMLACAGAQYGTFTATGYLNDEHPFAVRYAGGKGLVLGTDWVVDNFRYSDGVPDSHKRGPSYHVARDYDTDGDGQPDLHGVEEAAWDLRLENRRDDAVIWLESVPLSTNDRDKSLAVLARRLFDGMSGAESVVFEGRHSSSVVALAERRVAARPVASMPCRLSGRESFVVDIDVANVDALALSSTSRWRRVRLVIIRSGYEHRPLSRGEPFPVFLVAGYSNAPENFAAHEAEFERFLSQIALGTRSDDIPDTPAPHTCHAPQPPQHEAPPADAPAPVAPGSQGTEG